MRYFSSERSVCLCSIVTEWAVSEMEDWAVLFRHGGPGYLLPLLFSGKSDS